MHRRWRDQGGVCSKNGSISDSANKKTSTQHDQVGVKKMKLSPPLINHTPTLPCTCNATLLNLTDKSRLAEKEHSFEEQITGKEACKQNDSISKLNFIKAFREKKQKKLKKNVKIDQNDAAGRKAACFKEMSGNDKPNSTGFLTNEQLNGIGQNIASCNKKFNELYQQNLSNPGALSAGINTVQFIFTYLEKTVQHLLKEMAQKLTVRKDKECSFTASDCQCKSANATFSPAYPVENEGTIPKELHLQLRSKLETAENLLMANEKRCKELQLQFDQAEKECELSGQKCKHLEAQLNDTVVAVKTKVAMIDELRCALLLCEQKREEAKIAHKSIVDDLKKEKEEEKKLLQAQIISMCFEFQVKLEQVKNETQDVQEKLCKLQTQLEMNAVETKNQDNMLSKLRCSLRLAQHEKDAADVNYTHTISYLMHEKEVEQQSFKTQIETIRAEYIALKQEKEGADRNYTNTIAALIQEKETNRQFLQSQLERINQSIAAENKNLKAQFEINASEATNAKDMLSKYRCALRLAQQDKDSADRKYRELVGKLSLQANLDDTINDQNLRYFKELNQSKDVSEDFGLKWELLSVFRKNVYFLWEELELHKKVLAKIGKSLQSFVPDRNIILQPICIERNRVAEQALKLYTFFTRAENDNSVFAPLKITFKSSLGAKTVREQGVDESGLTNEFFTLLFEQLEDLTVVEKQYTAVAGHGKFKLFERSSKESGIIIPSQFCSSEGVPLRLSSSLTKIFFSIGRMLLRGLLHDKIIPSAFASSLMIDYCLGFERRRVKMPYSLMRKELIEVDPQYQWVLTQLDAALQASQKNVTFGDILASDDARFICNPEEAKKCLHEFILKQIINPRKEQFECIKNGFCSLEILNFTPFLEVCSYEEMQLLISGHEKLDGDCVLKCIVFDQFLQEEGDVVSYFKSAILGMEVNQLRCFLRFATGFTALPAGSSFQILVTPLVMESQNSIIRQTQGYPISHTCVKQVRIPIYSTEQMLRERLYEAIAPEHVQFHCF